MQDKHNSNGFYDLYHNPFTGNSEPRGYTYVAFLRRPVPIMSAG